MLDRAVTGDEGPITRLDGDPAEDVVAEDVVGSIDVERARAVVGEKAAPTNVMVGWADVGSPTTTVMARHGATALSLEKRFSGRGGYDAPLAPLGQAQAEALAAEIALRGGIDRVVASPLLRTRQTAQAVVDAIGVPVEVIDGFAECGFGEWDGHTFAEVRERWPNELEEWLASTDVAPPGGESFAACRDRVVAARNEVIARYPGERVLVVAHVTPIKVLVSEAVGAPLTSLYRMELPPCSITNLAWFPDGNASMFSFAESAHLRGVIGPSGT
jgi:probable phosphoglycerate mutase